VLLVSELLGDSVWHGGSGAAEETVTVAVRAGDGVGRVEVTDRGAPGCRGCVRLTGMRRAVVACASLRAWRRGGGWRTVTWFELSHG
jgi:hypothetical protein